MSASQQKLMQYLPVVFAVFQVFFLLGLVVYYIVQTVLRIAQQRTGGKAGGHGTGKEQASGFHPREH